VVNHLYHRKVLRNIKKRYILLRNLGDSLIRAPGANPCVARTRRVT
jgi:hypothetical protein